MLPFSVSLMNRLNKTESGILYPSLYDFLASKGSLFQNLLIITTAGVKCCVVDLKSLPLLHHSADYIFWSFGIIELMLVCFEYTILLKQALGGMKDVALFSISHEQIQ